MAEEEEGSRNMGDSKIFGNSKKERNHEPTEARGIIDQSLENIHCSL
jgi:hypothetical protein